MLLTLLIAFCISLITFVRKVLTAVVSVLKRCHAVTVTMTFDGTPCNFESRDGRHSCLSSACFTQGTLGVDEAGVLSRARNVTVACLLWKRRSKGMGATAAHRGPASRRGRSKLKHGRLSRPRDVFAGCLDLGRMVVMLLCTVRRSVWATGPVRCVYGVRNFIYRHQQQPADFLFCWTWIINVTSK